MEPSEKDIAELRQRALAQIQTEISKYCSKDIERLKNDNQYVRRFLLHHELDKDKAYEMVLTALKWRQSFGVQDITHSTVNMQILCHGGMFPHSRDKSGKKLFIIKAASTTKGTFKQEDLRRCLVYWFERMEREEKGNKVSVFFEMTGAGLSNLDMDFVQYLIQLFRDYYPEFLNQIIIFEMPWILNAAWKIIKTWMPAKSVELVKFVSRSGLKDLVPVNQQLVEWGGTDNYRFVFEPEQPQANSNDDSKKKVHFAEETNVSHGVQNGSLKNGLNSDGLLQFSASDELVFRRENSETTGTLVMKNTSNGPVAYKIKTTSPDKYRVRPSTGVLASEAELSINVLIQSGYPTAQLVRDRFLVISCKAPSDSLSQQQLNELWKNSSGETELYQHRLRCSVAASDAIDDFGASAKPNGTDLIAKLEAIHNRQEEITNQLKQTYRLLLAVIALVVLSHFFQ